MDDETPAPSRSVLALIVGGLVVVCRRLLPYALVALGLRLLMARVFFLDGQPKISGPVVPINLPGIIDVSVVLPAAVKASTFELFRTAYAGLPMSSATAAYLFSYAEFVVPVLLVVGFATRFAALALAAMTVLLQVYIAPDALWTLHAYWIGILVVLISLGPGAISFDAVIRRLSMK